MTRPTKIIIRNTMRTTITRAVSDIFFLISKVSLFICLYVVDEGKKCKKRQIQRIRNRTRNERRKARKKKKKEMKNNEIKKMKNQTKAIYKRRKISIK